MTDTDRNLIVVPGLGDVYIHSLIGSENPYPEFPCIPPHTGYAQQIASIDRGNNMHGSLNQNFYFCTNVSDQPDYFVIWQGDDGSQIDDGQARIYPGAFTLISPFRDDDGVARCSLAAAALLYRCLRELDFIGIGYDPDDGCAGGNMHDYCETKLSNEQVAEILQSALDGRPFKFIDAKARPEPQPRRGRSLSPEQAKMFNELAKLKGQLRQKGHEAYERARKKN